MTRSVPRRIVSDANEVGIPLDHSRMISLRFEIPGRPDPSRSLLGRYLSRESDPGKGEARYYVAVVVTLLSLTVAGFFSWVFVKPAVAGELLGAAAVVYWTVHAAVLMAFVGLCILGRRQRVVAVVDGSGITISQASRHVHLRREDLKSVNIVTDVTYHRHYRRYARVHPFIGARTKEVVIVRSSDVVIAVGIEGKDAHRLIESLRTVPVSPATQEIRLAL